MQRDTAKAERLIQFNRPMSFLLVVSDVITSDIYQKLPYLGHDDNSLAPTLLSLTDSRKDILVLSQAIDKETGVWRPK